MVMDHNILQRNEVSPIPRRILATLVVIALGSWYGTTLAADPPATGENQAYRLQNVDASTVAPQLQQMLSSSGAAADVAVDAAQNQILVKGSASVRQLAGQLVATLDKAPASGVAAPVGGPSKVTGYTVAPHLIDSTVEQLRKKYPPESGVRIAPDRRTSQLVVIASPEAHVEIANYMQTQANGSAEVVRSVPTGLTAGKEAKYRLQHLSAAEFEQSLQTLWTGVLAIHMDQTGKYSTVSLATDPARTPVMQIDRNVGEIEILAGGESSRSWRSVVAALDRSPHSSGSMTQLVPVRRADPAQVQQAVSMIRDAALRAEPGQSMAAVPVSQPGRPRSGIDLVSMIFQEAPGTPPATPPAAPAPQTPGGETPPAAQGGEGGEEGEMGLLGDVQIEFVPELGVIILRGNRRDVERVQKIIDEIERESEITRPEIQVVTLAHTNSEAMTTLVTQIYAEVYQPRQGSLSITALVKPNAILLVGRLDNIETALNLITKLDAPVEPEAQIKVFRLLHMSAVNAETYIRNFYGSTGTTGAATGFAQQTTQQTARGLSPRVTVIGDFRSNSLIVQASPRDIVEVAKLLEELDVEKTPATIEVRIFPLKNSMAATLRTVLQSTLSGQAQTGTAGGQQGFGGFQQGQQGFGQTGTGQNQTQISRSVQIVGIDQEGNKLIESGLMVDVQITSDDNSNALVVKAPSNSMDLIGALIEQLDRAPSAESQIKVFQIKNGDATNLTSMLQTLFGQQVTAGQVGMFSQTIGRTFGSQNTLLQSSAGESSLIPLNFGVDARTNSILASGSAADLAVVEAILLRLDEGDLRQRKLLVYRLNNAPAQFVADALTQILNEQYQLLSQQQSQQFSLISQFELIDQQVSVVPEIVSNTLIVSATPKYYEQITEVIEDLDRRPPMIMIQVVVCLVRLGDSEELGVELGLQDSLLFDRSATATGLLEPGFNFIDKPLGNSDSASSLASRGSLAGQAFGAFAVGRSSGSEGFPGLVLSAANESVNVLIRALAKKSRVQVLSRPQIMTLNNVPASVLVGQRIPQISNFQTTSAGNTVNSVELVDVGVSLGVIPRVTPDGLIIMDLEANDSKAGDPAEGITVGVQDGVPIQSPIYDDITAITTIAARSGQTVVFGGLITSERAETFRGVPFLSDIPVLGHLFRYDTRSDNRTELVFFLTPHIVMDDQDVEEMNQREADRMSWCLADVMQLHGDIGVGMGRSSTWGDGSPVIYPTVDPTAAGVMTPDSMEQVPAPNGESMESYGPTIQDDKPFVTPPDQRQEGKPFVLPPDQRQEGKPFLSPPDQRQEGKPFILPPAEATGEQTSLNQAVVQPAPIVQGSSQPVRRPAGWQAPEFAAPLPNNVIPPQAQPASAVPGTGVHGTGVPLSGAPYSGPRGQTAATRTQYLPNPSSPYTYVK
jgi:type II secretion system protein D